MLSRETAEWKRDMAEGAAFIADTVVDFARGLVVKAPVTTTEFVWHIGADATRYVIGVDSTLGEGRDRGFSEWRQRFWGTFDWAEQRPLSVQNPISGPFVRVGDVALTLGLGGLDMVTGHLPNLVFNDGFGLGITYFTPAPTTAEGMGEEIGMVGLMFAAPAMKAKATKTLKMMPKPEPVSESPRFIPETERLLEQDVSLWAKRIMGGEEASLHLLIEAARTNVAAALSLVSVAMCSRVSRIRSVARAAALDLDLGFLETAAESGQCAAGFALVHLVSLSHPDAGRIVRFLDPLAFRLRYKNKHIPECRIALDLLRAHGNVHLRTPSPVGARN